MPPAAEGRTPRGACPTSGCRDASGCWGYIDTCEELASDIASAGIERAHIVSAAGSGGTTAGLLLGVALHQLPATVWGINVCDDEAYFLDKIATDTQAWADAFAAGSRPPIDPRIIDGYVGAGYGLASEQVFALIRELSALEGVVLDPVYTAKAFLACCRKSKQVASRIHKT